jgi:hypothetical protein
MPVFLNNSILSTINIADKEGNALNTNYNYFIKWFLVFNACLSTKQKEQKSVYVNKLCLR